LAAGLQLLLAQSGTHCQMMIGISGHSSESFWCSFKTFLFCLTSTYSALLAFVWRCAVQIRSWHWYRHGCMIKICYLPRYGMALKESAFKY